MRLTEAFIKGKKVAYRFVPWNDLSEPVWLSQTKYDDLSTAVMSAILRTLPHQEDEKARMDLAATIRNEVMKEVGREITK